MNRLRLSLVLALALCLALPRAALGSTVTGNLQDVLGTNRPLARLIFTPKSTPYASGTTTIVSGTRTTWATNGAFSIWLLGGLYDVDIDRLQTIRILVPPDDTNTLGFNYCANLATNLGSFIWTNPIPSQLISRRVLPGTNVVFLTNSPGTVAESLTVSATGTGGGVSESTVTNISRAMAAEVTNSMPGTVIADSTINSNKLDAATLALLGTGGGVSESTVTNISRAMSAEVTNNLSGAVLANNSVSSNKFDATVHNWINAAGVTRDGVTNALGYEPATNRGPITVTALSTIVGDNDPSGIFDVAGGTLRFGNLFSGAVTNVEIWADDQGQAAPSLVLDAVSGNVGVARYDPQQRLHVGGRIQADEEIYSGGSFYGSNLVNSVYGFRMFALEDVTTDQVDGGAANQTNGLFWVKIHKGRAYPWFAYQYDGDLYYRNISTGEQRPGYSSLGFDDTNGVALASIVSTTTNLFEFTQTNGTPAAAISSAGVLHGNAGSLTNLQIALNVRDFGADHTGAADASASVQAALDSLSTNAYWGNGVKQGAVIKFPKGHYKISSTVNFPKLANQGKLFIDLDNSSIEIANNTTGFDRWVTNQTEAQLLQGAEFVFRGGTFVGEAGGSNQVAIRMGPSYRASFEHCKFQSLSHAVDAYFALDASFRNCNFVYAPVRMQSGTNTYTGTNWTDATIANSQCNQARFEGCEFYPHATNNYAVAIYGASQPLFLHCTFQGSSITNGANVVWDNMGGGALSGITMINTHLENEAAGGLLSVVGHNTGVITLQQVATPTGLLISATNTDNVYVNVLDVPYTGVLGTNVAFALGGATNWYFNFRNWGDTDGPTHTRWWAGGTPQTNLHSFGRYSSYANTLTVGPGGLSASNITAWTGIGTNSPQRKLHVEDSTSGVPLRLSGGGNFLDFTIGGASSGIALSTPAFSFTRSSNPQLTIEADGDLRVGTYTTLTETRLYNAQNGGLLYLGSAGLANKVLLDASGVGIGTNDPTRKLHVDDTAGGTPLRLSGGTNWAEFKMGDSSFGLDVASRNFSIYHASTPRLTVEADGDLRVGSYTTLTETRLYNADSGGAMYLGSAGLNNAVTIDGASATVTPVLTANAGVRSTGSNYLATVGATNFTLLGSANTIQFTGTNGVVQFAVDVGGTNHANGAGITNLIAGNVRSYTNGFDGTTLVCGKEAFTNAAANVTITGLSGTTASEVNWAVLWVSNSAAGTIQLTIPSSWKNNLGTNQFTVTNATVRVLTVSAYADRMTNAATQTLY